MVEIPLGAASSLSVHLAIWVGGSATCARRAVHGRRPRMPGRSPSPQFSGLWCFSACGSKPSPSAPSLAHC
eukprot:scaffold9692_cov96-Isochrysis_galbana.AAC.7